MNKPFSWILGLMLMSLGACAWAANFSDPINGTFRGSYGDTISVEVPSTVSKSADINGDQNGELTFKVNSNTGYRNFNQLADLKNGDPVRVEYTQDPNAKTDLLATIITKTAPAPQVTTVNSQPQTTVITSPGNQSVTTTSRMNPQ